MFQVGLWVADLLRDPLFSCGPSRRLVATDSREPQGVCSRYCLHMAAEPARTGASSPADAGGGSAPPHTTGSFTGAYQARPDRERIDERPRGRKLAILSLTALGVVFGDIGTSPLYAIKECFSPASGIAPTAPNVYGALSLVVWALTLVVSVKYLSFIMRADNRGEGGILAL